MYYGLACRAWWLQTLNIRWCLGNRHRPHQHQPTAYSDSSVVCRRSLQQECPIPTTTVLNLTSAAAQVGNVTAAASAGTAALSACVTSFMGQFTTADVNLGSIMALNSCPFTTSWLPLALALAAAGLLNRML
ncbi:hypothetical protein HaLaN_17779 [Haematococcus lacustris]|uniref:Uncharacterized protein n=1 Tax=Haematococcus lacustris TaxID=44745 RepID=A0A699ZQF9_HAELA|nr:hypothetical protein HaLaN_17779 [Haematococcus lacustris]